MSEAQGTIERILATAENRMKVADQELTSLREAGYTKDDARWKTALAFYSDACADVEFLAFCLTSTLKAKHKPYVHARG